jgi:hypothetical protein
MAECVLLPFRPLRKFDVAAQVTAMPVDVAADLVRERAFERERDVEAARRWLVGIGWQPSQLDVVRSRDGASIEIVIRRCVEWWARDVIAFRVDVERSALNWRVSWAPQIPMPAPVYRWIWA